VGVLKYFFSTLTLSQKILFAEVICKICSFKKFYMGMFVEIRIYLGF